MKYQNLYYNFSNEKTMIMHNCMYKKELKVLLKSSFFDIFFGAVNSYGHVETGEIIIRLSGWQYLIDLCTYTFT